MPADTKTALLEIAEDVVRRRGFDGFSYADLSEAIGIRKASIHYHFPTKAALSAALVERYHHALAASCEEITAQHAGSAARLRALIDVYRDALGDGDKVCLCVSLIASRESLSDEALEKISAFRAMMVGWIAQNFELSRHDQSVQNVKKPLREAQAMLAVLEGAHLAARAASDVGLFDEAVALLTDRLTP